MKKIAIAGAGGLGRDIAMLIEQINLASSHWEIIGFFDDSPKAGKDIYGYPLLGNINDLNGVNHELAAVIAIADTRVKKEVDEKLVNPNLYYPVLVHPSVISAKNEYVRISAGSVISAGCIVTANVNVGRHVLVNHQCVIGHDCIIGDYTSIMPGVTVSGETVIGERVYLGTGAVIINGITVGPNTIVGAGAVVSENLPSNCTAVGLPARPIKYHDASTLSA